MIAFCKNRCIYLVVPDRIEMSVDVNGGFHSMHGHLGGSPLSFDELEAELLRLAKWVRAGLGLSQGGRA